MFFSMCFFVRQAPDWWATFLPCVEPIPSLDERPEEGGERWWFGRWGSGEVVGRYGVDQAALWLDSYGDQTSQGGQEHVSVGVWELVPLRLLVLWQWVGASNSVDECRYDSLFSHQGVQGLEFRAILSSVESIDGREGDCGSEQVGGYQSSLLWDDGREVSKGCPSLLLLACPGEGQERRHLLSFCGLKFVNSPLLLNIFPYFCTIL